jgi:hypothetical protein
LADTRRSLRGGRHSSTTGNPTQGEKVVARKLKVEITTPNGRKTIVEHTTDWLNYQSDLAALKEVWGEKSVREIEE